MQVIYVTLDPSDTHAELLFSGCVLAERAMWQCARVCHSMRHQGINVVSSSCSVGKDGAL